MKRIFTLLLSLCMLLSLFTLVSCDKTEEDDEKLTLANFVGQVIDVPAGDPVVITGEAYDQPLLINAVEGSTVMFSGCTFNQKIYFNGTGGSKAIFDADNTIAENVSITMFNEVKEATIDTPLPRVILLMPIPCFTEYQGTILASGISELSIDGVTYTLETCEYGLDAGDTVVPYDPNAGYTIFGVGTWWENGEKVIFSFAAAE
ncbi:MAG: hypothetical protein IKZ09_07475 [Clostridia bacterium]|nr:hypothetical protein [Clostridia bacterium]